MKAWLSKDVSLNTRVEAARFDEIQGCWILETIPILILGYIYHSLLDFASKPYIPDLPG